MREIGEPVDEQERWRERMEAALEERRTEGGSPELAAAVQRIGDLGR